MSITQSPSTLKPPSQFVKKRMARKALLGNSTGIVSAKPSLKEYIKKSSSNDRKWTLKRYAEKLMRSSRTDYCMRYRGRNAETVDLYYDDNIKNAHYQGLAHCDNPWACPVCSATIASRRASEVRKALDKWHGSSIMITYTMKHHKGNDPDLLVKQLRDALRKLYKDRWGQKFKKYIGWFGTITNLDITYHERNGWHIHIHQVVLLDPRKTVINVMDENIIKRIVETELQDRWVTCLHAFGGDAESDIGLRVSAGEQFQREYVAKFGRLPESGKSMLHREVTQSTHKQGKPNAYEKGLHPFQILELSKGNKNSHYAYLWSRFVSFTKGRNQLTWSPKLKAYFGIDELEDEEIIEDGEQRNETKELLFEIPYLTWEGIVHFDERAILLNLTVRYAGNVDEIKPYFADVDKRYARHMYKKSQEKINSDKLKDSIWDVEFMKKKMLWETEKQRQSRETKNELADSLSKDEPF